jgi:hypothetical protein
MYCRIWSHKIFSLFLIVFTFILIIHINIQKEGEKKVQLNSSLCGCPVVPVPPFVHHESVTIVEKLVDQRPMNVFVHSAFCFMNLHVYPKPKTYCLDYCSFVVSFEIRKCECSKCVLDFQDGFGYSGSLTQLLMNLATAYQFLPRKQGDTAKEFIHFL